MSNKQFLKTHEKIEILADTRIGNKKWRFWKKPIKAKTKLPAAAPAPALEIKPLMLWPVPEVWQLLVILESKNTLFNGNLRELFKELKASSFT